LTYCDQFPIPDVSQHSLIFPTFCFPVDGPHSKLMAFILGSILPFEKGSKMYFKSKREKVTLKKETSVTRPLLKQMMSPPKRPAKIILSKKTSKIATAKTTPVRRPLLSISHQTIEKLCLTTDNEEIKVHSQHFANRILAIFYPCNCFQDIFFDVCSDLLKTFVLLSHLGMSKLRQMHKDFKHLDLETKKQLNFALSTMIGTLLFYIMFECVHFMIHLHITLLFRSPKPSLTFALSYALSYLTSVIWQHMLNRWLVFPAANDDFCESLLQTYVVYGCSLIGTSIIGSAIISITNISPEIVLFITLPLAGLSNYFLLKALFERTSTASLQNSQEELIII